MGIRAGSPPLAKASIGKYNLVELYRKADAVDITSGLLYYQSFRHKLLHIGEICGCHDAAIIIGVFVALSPNNSESSNLRDALHVLSSYHNKPWESISVHTYGANKDKARLILEGENPEKILRGPKTNSFYHNLLEPGDPSYVTVDGHMVNAFNNIKVPLDYAGISASSYCIIRDVVKEIAAGLGIIPCQLQSILWLTWRRINGILYNPQYKLDLGDCL